MEFTFAQVERALALTYSIADNKRSAFAYRLKHLQKLGFPAGINTGRGRAATYNVGHLYLLGVALELGQLGLNPERAIAVIESDMHTIAMAASMAATKGPPQGKFEFPTFLYLDPAALSDLMKAREEDRAVASFFYAGMGQMMEDFKNWFNQGASRMALFSVSTLLWDLASYSQKPPERLPIHFYEELAAWADPYIHNQEASDVDS